MLSRNRSKFLIGNIIFIRAFVDRKSGGAPGVSVCMHMTGLGLFPLERCLDEVVLGAGDTSRKHKLFNKLSTSDFEIPLSPLHRSRAICPGVNSSGLSGAFVELQLIPFGSVSTG